MAIIEIRLTNKELDQAKKISFWIEDQIHILLQQAYQNRNGILADKLVILKKECETLSQIMEMA